MKEKISKLTDDNTIKKILNRTLIAIITLFLSGCIGASTISEKQEVVNYPLFEILSERANFRSIPSSHYQFSNPNYIPYHYKKYSKEDVLTLWGNPDSRKNKQDLEYWNYKREIGFSGLMLGVLIPLPLLVPVGYRDTILVFKNDELQSVVREYGDLTHGFFCVAPGTLVCMNKNTQLEDILM